MKKLISFVLALSMALSFSVGILAEELSTACTVGERVCEVSLELNKPLEFFTEFEDEEGADAQYVLSELAKSKLTFTVKSEISEDNLAGRVYVKSNAYVPVRVHEDLKFSADMTNHTWVEYDFSNEENRKLVVVEKTPGDNIYWYFDVFSKEYNIEDIVPLKGFKITESPTLKGTVKWEEVVKAFLEGNARVVYENNTTTISFSEVGLINGVMDALVTEGGMEITTEKDGETTVDLGKENVDMFKSTLKALGVFSEEDALVIRVSDNAYEARLHLQFNAYLLGAALGKTDDFLYPLNEENSDIDITVKVKITENEAAGGVEMPYLTEENSVDCIDVIKALSENNQAEKEAYMPETVTAYCDGMYDRGGMYVRCEDLSSDYYDKLRVEATCDKKTGDVKVVITSDYMEKVEIKGNFDRDEYTVNGVQMRFRKPFSYVDEYNWEKYDADRYVYINTELLSIIGGKVRSMSMNYTDYYGNELKAPTCSIAIIRPNGAYGKKTEADGNKPSRTNAAGVGIIGGADGPTAVFVTEIK